MYSILKAYLANSAHPNQTAPFGTLRKADLEKSAHDKKAGKERLKKLTVFFLNFGMLP